MSLRPRRAPGPLDFALLRGAMEETPIGVATMRGGELLYANAAFERMLRVDPGELEGRRVRELFDDVDHAAIESDLAERRVYDGRVRVLGRHGHAIHAEVHVERYTSASADVGGFLRVRDGAFELGALGRLLDQ